MRTDSAARYHPTTVNISSHNTYRTRENARPEITGSKASSFYRHDLDGLRGVAIALVVIFHIWVGRVSGGIDVFLVLSGFFFGGSLLRTTLTSQSQLSLGSQLIRLVRRLMPAMVVVLAVTAVLTVMVQPQTRWETFANQTLASLGYYQNWELAHNAADYSRAGETISPLQHIWSLSVQGQFYLVFLVGVIVCGAVLRRITGEYLRSAFIGLLSALTVASFIFAIIAQHDDYSTAYYNSFARAWELLVGVLVGALVSSIRWPQWLRNLLAGIAVVTIVFCGAFLDGARQFPGPWALVPVGATVLLILTAANYQTRLSTGHRLPLVNRVLATKPLVALGSIAYCLYLWHWPLLVLWLVHTGNASVGVLDGAAIALVSGVLAVLTRRFIEQPLRVHRSAGVVSAFRSLTLQPLLRPSLRLMPNRRPVMALGAIVILLIVALVGTSLTWREHVIIQRAQGNELAGLTIDSYPGARALLDHSRVPTLPMRPTVFEAKNDLPDSTKNGCISTFTNAEVINCTYGDTSASRTIALAGGSHAEHWITALDALGKKYHFKIVTYLKMGCPLTTERFPLVMGNNRDYPNCYTWNRKVMDKIIADHPDYVFTTSTRPWNTKPGDMMPATYIGIWKSLSDNNIPILAMRDTPWLVRNKKPLFPADCLASGGDAVSCGVKRSQVLSSRNQTLDFVSRFPLLLPLDMSDAVCRADICRAVEGNVLIYHDSHHLSTTYVRTMTDELGRQIGAATKWW